MLSPNQIQSYEQQSVRRALCAGCMQELQEDEHYVCETCANLCRECLQLVKQNGGGEKWLRLPGENAKSAMNGSIRHSQISGGAARNTELN